MSDRAERDPWASFGLPPDSDEAAVRARYLELVREFPPERAPERFAEIRAAYNLLMDSDAVIARRLWTYSGDTGLDKLAREMVMSRPRPRLGLDELLASHRMSE